MVQTIRKIGNSRGVILSKAMLQQVGISDKVEMEVTDHSIILKKYRQARENWEQTFAQAMDNGEQPENDMFEGLENNFDQTDWQCNE